MLNELIDFGVHGAKYITKSSNLFDFTTIIAVGISADIMRRHRNEPSPQLEYFDAYALFIAGIILGVELLKSLRSTFLPYAKFAGGLLVIVGTLIPFFVVCSLFLISFTFAYRILYSFPITADTQLDFNTTCAGPSLASGIIECGCIHSFYRCFFVVMESFFSAETAVNDFANILFGLFAILVLLTIAIAIVRLESSLLLSTQVFAFVFLPFFHFSFDT